MPPERSSERLIVFARLPEPGKVKSRLARGIGPRLAEHLYRLCLGLTIRVVRRTGKGRAFCWTGHDPSGFLPDASFFGSDAVFQQGRDLGERMYNAFDRQFRLGCRAVVIIGADCPDLDARTIKEAFGAVRRYGAVVGPSRDGGYYLLGLSSRTWRQRLGGEQGRASACRVLFEDMPWGTGSVLAKTKDRLRRLNVRTAFLPVLSDFDNARDLNPRILNILLS